VDNADPDYREIIDSLRAGGHYSGSPPLPPRDGRSKSEGMDPWQQSVETRLSSLDTRLGKIEPNVADIKTDVAVLKATAATKVDLTTLGDKLLLRMQIYAGLVVVAMGAATWLGKHL
jgi:hypothetical protein